jgi:hypothetical protein
LHVGDVYSDAELQGHRASLICTTGCTLVNRVMSAKISGPVLHGAERQERHEAVRGRAPVGVLRPLSPAGPPAGPCRSSAPSPRGRAPGDSTSRQRSSLRRLGTSR